MRFHPFKPFLLQAKQSHLSQLFLVGEMLQSLNGLSGFLLDFLQYGLIFLILGSPEQYSRTAIKGLEYLPIWLECFVRINLKFRITTVGFFSVTAVRSLAVLFSSVTTKITGTVTLLVVVYAI